MSLSKHKCMPSYDFPEEILSEIFKRLPVKYVLRCRAVQKSWYHLIKSPMFISLHINHQKMTAHDNPKYLLFHDTSTHTLTIRSDDKYCQEYCRFDFPLDLPNSLWYAQSNGLVCVSTMFDKVFDYKPDIFIWNPLVQKYKIVPRSPLSTFTNKEIRWKALAFGYLPELNDYVVVHIVKPSLTSEPPSFDYIMDDQPVAYEDYPHSVFICVYSLKSNSWREICQVKVFVDYMSSDQSVFVNGTAFWVGYSSDLSRQLVMYFDTKTNILQKIMLHDSISVFQRQLENPLILPFRQWIAYFLEVNEGDAPEDDEDGYPHLEIWELKVKADKIGEFFWKNCLNASINENDWADVLGIRNNGDPILAESNNLISYDTYRQYDFVKSCDRLTSYSYYEEGSKAPFVIRPFVETLLFMDID